MSEAVLNPPTVQKFRGRRVIESPVTRPSAPALVASQAPQPKLVEKLSATAKPKSDEQALRTDGPTLEEYVAAGYDPEGYPPEGYAPRLKVYVFAKLRGTMARTDFGDGTFHQWLPKPAHSGGYLATTSFETSDPVLAEKLRQAAKKDSSIREVIR